MHGGFTFLCVKCSKPYKTAFNRKRHNVRCGTDPAQSPAREAEAEGQEEREDVRTERSALQNTDQYLEPAPPRPRWGTGSGPSMTLAKGPRAPWMMTP